MTNSDVCANCKGMIGDLAEGREPEEFCDTCYEDSQQASRHAWDDLKEELERVRRT
jgi:hypothetical protein